MAPMRISLILLVLLLLFLIGTGAAIPEEKLKEVRAKHEKALFDLGDVSAVSHDETTGEIIVYVEKPEHEQKIPKKMDEIPVRVEVIGKIYALKPAVAVSTTSFPFSLPINRKGVVRPLIGGISVGIAGFPTSAGTLGVIAEKDGNPVILSNAHVLALDRNAKFLRLGTAIWQPGGYDGGSSSYRVGSLKQYIPITFNNYFAKNFADAAIGSIDTGISSLKGYVLDGDNTGLIPVTGVATVTPGMIVWKSGRTSNVSSGTVSNSVATVKVQYTSSKFAYFRDQIITSRISEPGDSGSAVWFVGVDTKSSIATNYFVGLLFAGSDQVTIVCKDTYLKNSLGILIHNETLPAT